jgi:hypothetical protein
MADQGALELGKLYQLGYVTGDMGKAIKQAEAMFGVDDFLDFGELDSDVADGVARVRVAQGLLGDTVFELIQPVGGDDRLYAEYLSEDAPEAIRFHHLAYYQDDPDAWRRFLAAVDERQIPIVVSGKSPNSEFVYIDVRKDLGHYAEVVHRYGGPLDVHADRARVKAAIAARQAAASAPA